MTPACRWRAPCTSGGPGLPAAYRHGSQYMLGDALLVAPVTRPGLVRTDAGLVPAGHLDEPVHGRHRRRPGRADRPGHAADHARLRAGGRDPAPAPSAPNVASQPPDALRLTVFPHASGRTALYDDAGEGLAYRRGAFARTPVRYTERRRPGRRCGGLSRLAIGPARGTYAGQPARRTYTVAFVGVSRPCRVTVDGAAAAHTYQRARRRLVVRVTVGRRAAVAIAHDGRPLTRRHRRVEATVSGSRRGDSNPWPTLYKSVALPTELLRPVRGASLEPRRLAGHSSARGSARPARNSARHQATVSASVRRERDPRLPAGGRGQAGVGAADLRHLVRAHAALVDDGARPRRPRRRPAPRRARRAETARPEQTLNTPGSPRSARQPVGLDDVAHVGEVAPRRRGCP